MCRPCNQDLYTVWVCVYNRGWAAELVSGFGVGQCDSLLL